MDPPVHIMTISRNLMNLINLRTKCKLTNTIVDAERARKTVLAHRYPHPTERINNNYIQSVGIVDGADVVVA